jgi:hypothetical protein
MTTETTGKNRIERAARLAWVPISLMRVSPLAQRDLNRARVDRIAADFDLEQVGTPTVNKRGGGFYIIDGQHRVEALKEIGWGDQQIQCWTYEGLSEDEEAEKFLKLNDVLAVSAFVRFRVGVQAGRGRECDIDRIVRAAGLTVSQDKTDGAVAAVGTLTRIYDRAGARTLARTLGIVRDAYGSAGLDAAVLDGIGYLCGRYNGDLEDQLAVLKLTNVMGGVSGLLGKSEVLRKQTGLPRGHCVAAAAVEIINSGRGGKKLTPWFRENAA